MMQQDQNISVNDIIQTVLDDQVSVDLRPRDVAFLVLIRHQIDSRLDLSFSIEGLELRTLSSRIDNLDVKDITGSEKRLTESLNRLIRADCLTRSDLNRLSNSDDIEYQLTSLGENVANWHFEHTKFTGEPLAAILRAFNSQLVEIHLRSKEADTEEEWRSEVLIQMQVVIKDMLVNIQRHQRELDKQHEALRAFIPSLLNESSESSIDLCEQQLSQAIRTIEDLYEVTLTASSKAYDLLDQIQADGESKNIPDVDHICQSISRRMESIAQWTSQRVVDWVEHHGVVHSFLRSVIRVDRQRRLTESLKKSIASPPEWSFAITSEPPFMRMREDALQKSRKRTAPRMPKKKYIRETDEMHEDEMPARLFDLFERCIADGEASWSQIVLMALENGEKEEEIIAHLPWLMGKMIDAGQVESTSREWKAVTNSLQLQELKVRSQ